MVFKHKFFQLEYRNDNLTSQKNTINTFFEAHTIEFWDVGDNETLFGTYDENNLTGATSFTTFDAGVGGIEANIDTLNTNTTLANFIAANQIIKMMVVEDRIILLQYIAR